ncbi:MAG: tripartite tricarboxylate transporter substrate binding protein [Pseudomonadota bacterium]|jgi:tripartite-type tricarboxylate transporter receptor subunit TctC
MNIARTLTAILVAPLASLSLSASAQDYPTRPIRWVVPYLAGTAPDNTVRIVAEAMGNLLKQPVVVDNKGGAAGNLGAQLVARAPADGYTWIYSAAPMAANMRMYKKPGFDTMKDFTHVGRIAISDLTVVVHPDAGIKNLQGLMERAKKEPGKLSYASGGIGSPAHMGAELMLSLSGAQALHVPYKGASESTTAVIGKQVDFALAISSVALPHIKAGRLQALAVSGPQRNARQPNTPTLAESGLSGLQLTSFGGLSVPAGTPAPVVKRLSEALNQVLAMPEVRTRLEAQGGSVAPASPEEYRDALQAEMALTERMMKSAKLEAQ